MSVFAESLRRLYVDSKIDEEKVIELFNNDKITEDEKKYILDVDCSL